MVKILKCGQNSKKHISETIKILQTAWIKERGEDIWKDCWTNGAGMAQQIVQLPTASSLLLLVIVLFISTMLIYILSWFDI
jgi:hypothetical protein